MTFKQYLKTPEAKKKIKAILKKRKRFALPQSPKSRYVDTSNMGATFQLPAATQGNQPSLS